MVCDGHGPTSPNLPGRTSDEVCRKADRWSCGWRLAKQAHQLLSAFVRAALSLLLPALPGDDRLIRHVAAEDIQRAADTKIDTAAPALFHAVEVGQLARAAG